MATLKLLSGTVSSARTHADTSGEVRGTASTVTGSVSTTFTTSFRLNGRPTKMDGTPNLTDGDVVTVVGYDEPEFRAVGLRNDTSGVIYRSEMGIADWKVWTVMLIAGFISLFKVTRGAGGLDSEGVLMLMVSGVTVFGCWTYMGRNRALRAQVSKLLR